MTLLRVASALLRPIINSAISLIALSDDMAPAIAETSTTGASPGISHEHPQPSSSSGCWIIFGSRSFAIKNRKMSVAG